VTVICVMCLVRDQNRSGRGRYRLHSGFRRAAGQRGGFRRAAAELVCSA
jgi:hypothetical protein